MPDEESISGATITNPNNAHVDDNSRPKDPQHCEGYHKLADMMADYPAAAIFRGFGSLNALNLLYYQAELSLLEHQLKLAAEKDRQSSDQFRKVYFQSHQWLSQGRAEGSNMSPEENQQWKLVLKIRQVLKEYNEAVLAQSTIKRLTHPSIESRNYLREWMADDGSNEYIYLVGKDCNIYWKTNYSDLIATYAREYEDFFSTWITERATYWWNRFIGHRFQKKSSEDTWMASTAIYPRRHVRRLITLLAVSIASALPIISIVVLNSVKGTNSRLGIMALFTVLFCAMFGLFLGAKKTEMLAASAAFAAVQVVFVSGDGSCCRNS